MTLDLSNLLEVRARACLWRLNPITPSTVCFSPAWGKSESKTEPEEYRIGNDRVDSRYRRASTRTGIAHISILATRFALRARKGQAELSLSRENSRGAYPFDPTFARLIRTCRSKRRRNRIEGAGRVLSQGGRGWLCVLHNYGQCGTNLHAARIDAGAISGGDGDVEPATSRPRWSLVGSNETR